MALTSVVFHLMVHVSALRFVQLNPWIFCQSLLRAAAESESESGSRVHPASARPGPMGVNMAHP
eukprot:768593-Hanusia_phi.AAC.4